MICSVTIEGAFLCIVVCNVFSLLSGSSKARRHASEFQLYLNSAILRGDE